MTRWPRQASSAPNIQPLLIHVSTASEILTEDFEFRGSLGAELSRRGRVQALCGVRTYFAPLALGARFSNASQKKGTPLQRCGARVVTSGRFATSYPQTSKFIGWERLSSTSRTVKLSGCGFSAISQAWMRCSRKMRAQDKRDCHLGVLAQASGPSNSLAQVNCTTDRFTALLARTFA